jgi:hypothetical protein
MDIVGHDSNVLASVRDLYSRRPETHFLGAWELQHVLRSLRYTGALAEEVEIVAAIEVAQTDFDPEAGAA